MSAEFTLQIEKEDQVYHAWFEEVGRKYGYTAETPGAAARGALAMVEQTIDLMGQLGPGSDA